MNFVQQNREGDAILVSLRPDTLEDYIGQEEVKKKLYIAMKAAKLRNEPLDHILFSGPPGLGKTTLAFVIAKEMGKNIHITSGPVLERQGDIAAILSSIEEGDILFIDEIHRINKAVEEVFYSALEDYKVDIMIGKGPTARSIRIGLKPFTLVGATTRSGLLSSPLRNRFGMILELQFYTVKELMEIIKRACKIMNIEIEESAAQLIASRARGTPRIALRLLKRVRDVATIRKENKIISHLVEKTMDILEIDKLGLDEMDRKILRTLIEIYDGGPVGIEALAATLNLEIDTLKEIHEPYLLQQGLIIRTPRGRVATGIAYEHLGYPSKISGGLFDESLRKSDES
ncbi:MULTISPECIES: Holliday junction branch migration DNA helicase RuvB [Pseudothermotoga]|jgi:Holliday junction DNA helicase RuvB|uniref:Holliday junction branch migration complex subunit RuvB n=1 Tax=Pseudothermotoga lettingae (strain ATCC BAA-301 / DSM 14385 / NBRC 107922 / TMO) TaxID=416591 RepID=RUVB_PSELT|nr:MULTISPECIES: Holliday junction branch migration DNA helicase RuvB [Pseudothermotoga]A8F5R0.1 RecName: Full=Holliday junction branch migration complex subunit RuvB [Pseudothermotoga lettingae TMO]ABV33494.1 Holliday junction DNA helicase RuvB [Pseudothermotoga lettingae TMO]KUK20295.1 MAG: Holliday junction ATP-dependent DNA helicase RuvB [Pseudothermotoga lettingae]MDI3495479.1 holliday junction helicase RuvB [Pseudothermotoga sp.]MDK2883858.1 holliday junction helicase RuvB [Pseudothermot